jgi:hypothetical protein
MTLQTLRTLNESIKTAGFLITKIIIDGKNSCTIYTHPDGRNFTWTAKTTPEDILEAIQGDPILWEQPVTTI